MIGIDLSLEYSDNRAFCSTHLQAISTSRPSVATVLSWIRDPRLKDFATGFDPFLAGGAILLGPTGIGKSVACFCVMRRMMPASLGFWGSHDALDIGLDSQRTPLGQPEPDAVSRAKRATCLILDDLGWERTFHVDTIVDIAATRYKIGKPTLVTSGKTMLELKERYGDAVLRRFTDVGGSRGVVLDCWKSAP